MADDVFELDSEIDRLAKVHAEAGFPSFDRYLLGLPVRLGLLGDEPRSHPVETTVAWTDPEGSRNEQTVRVQQFEVTEFVRHRAELVYGPKGHLVGPGD